jgi:hypothetical protein
MKVFVGLGLVVLSVFSITGCGGFDGKYCSPGTHAGTDNMTCVADSPDDMGVIACGPNQVLVGTTCMTGPGACATGVEDLNDMGVCVPNSSICQAPGTELRNGACVPVSDGTLVASATFTQSFNTIYYMNSGVPTVVGTISAVTATGVDDNTPLVNIKGVPLGGAVYQARYPQTPPGSAGPFVPVNTTLDVTHQITLGEWKKCNGSVSWYKPPAAINGVNMYKQVINVAGCIPNSLWSVWHFWTPDGTRASAAFGAPSAGIPNNFITDNQGAAHYERYLDPNAWFKIGQNVMYAGAHTPPTIVFDPSNPTYANSGLITALFYHSSGQTNDNMGYCEKDIDAGTCQPVQPPVINFLQVKVFAFQHLLHEPAIKIGLLQPY